MSERYFDPTNCQSCPRCGKPYLFVYWTYVPVEVRNAFWPKGWTHFLEMKGMGNREPSLRRSGAGGERTIGVGFSSIDSARAMAMIEWDTTFSDTLARLHSIGLHEEAYRLKRERRDDTYRQRMERY